MKHRALAAAAAAFAGAVILRLAFPTLGSVPRGLLRSAAERDGAYQAVFAPEDAEPAAEPTEVPAASPAPRLRPVEITETAVPESEAAAFPELALPTPSPEPAPPEPTPLPAAVQTFLDSQTAFADLALPEKVDYDYAELPFDYAVPVAGYNSSGFGYRLHPILQTVRFHYGTDFAAWTGEKILAFADGTVSYAGYDESFGWHLKLDHGDGWQTLYAHCSQLLVSAGQSVEKGSCVALVGGTGLATGPHLHFELTHDGRYLNPEYYVNG